MTARRSKTAVEVTGPWSPSPASAERTQNASAIRKVFLTLCGWIEVQNSSRSSAKRLRVAETVSLGEKRFVAVVHVDGLQFLVGGSSNNVSLLAQLTGSQEFHPPFEEVIKSAAPISKRSRKAASVLSQVGSCA